MKAEVSSSGSYIHLRSPQNRMERTSLGIDATGMGPTEGMVISKTTAEVGSPKSGSDTCTCRSPPQVCRKRNPKAPLTSFAMWFSLSRKRRKRQPWFKRRNGAAFSRLCLHGWKRNEHPSHFFGIWREACLVSPKPLFCKF